MDGAAPMTQALLVTVAAWILAGIFLLAAVHKIRHRLAFRGILADYRLLPGPLLPLIAPLVIGAEFLAAILILAPANIIPPPLAALPAAVLLFLYTGAIAVNLVRGRTGIDCGCGGAATPLSAWLLLRNGLLLGLAGIVAIIQPAPVAPVIYLFAAAPILFFWCAYAAGNQMLANAGPRQADRQAVRI